jgi:hypothetical protein
LNERSNVTGPGFRTIVSGNTPNGPVASVVKSRLTVKGAIDGRVVLVVLRITGSMSV